MFPLEQHSSAMFVLRPPGVPLPRPRAARVAAAITESCPFKAIMSGLGGAGLGAVFGLFMGSMESSLPHWGAQATTPVTEQLWLSAKVTLSKAKGMAKSFGGVGMLYTGFDCVTARVRAKHDMYNGMIAGCATGASLAYRNGPVAMVTGCLGFAGFGLAIELIQQMKHERTHNAPPTE